MDTPAGTAMPPLPDLTGRSFALLDQAERDRLRTPLRPLAWIDGLLTAVVATPGEPDNLSGAPLWGGYIWNEESEDEILKLTPDQVVEVVTHVTEHYAYVTTCLLDEPETYRPYLGGFSDPLEAAAQWAGGFCGGISLGAERWAAVFADEDALSLLVAVFCLLHDQDLPKELKAESPFRDMPPDRRAHMRRAAVEMLPDIVRALCDNALALDENGD